MFQKTINFVKNTFSHEALKEWGAVTAIIIAIAILGCVDILILKKQRKVDQQTQNPVVASANVEKPTPVFFQIKIPKLKIDVPVIADVPGYDETAYLNALENGVAHFAGTAKPGEGGNIFIFGHSAYYPDKPGDYKEIFRKLTDIDKGDQIEITYGNNIYEYVVSSTKTVKPIDVKYLNPTPSEQLTLMTCVPPGSLKYRLIVIAKPKE